MLKPKANAYLKSQILTAPKEQLLLMLFDGAIRFAEQAKQRLAEEKFEDSCNLLIRAQRIMVELVSSLDKDALPEEIYTNLVRLYNFVYFRLIDGNLKKDAEKIDEALVILNNLRETWRLAIEQDRKLKYPETQALEKTAPKPVDPAVKSLEMQG